MNRFQFAQEYAAHSSTSVLELAKAGRVARECDCGEEECEGWQMAHLCTVVRKVGPNGEGRNDPKQCDLESGHTGNHRWNRDVLDEWEAFKQIVSHIIGGPSMSIH